MSCSTKCIPPHFWAPYAVIIGGLSLLLWLFPLEVESFGTIDYVQYWSAWRLMVHGQNPYDPFLLHQTQSALSTPSSPLIYSWNPPWTYTLLAPFLIPPFTLGATLWLLFQVSALLFIALNAAKAVKVHDLGILGGACVALFFLPSLYAIYYGQLGILFALSLTVFLLAINGDRYTAAGVSLIPLAVKPHLFVLFVIPGVLWLIQISREQRKRFLIGAVGGFAVLLGITLAIQPTSVTWWFNAITGPPIPHEKLVPFKQWMTHTSTTGLRLLLNQGSVRNPTWPLLAVPVGAFILTLVYFLTRRPRVDWSALLPMMLCVCLATSSYAWVYDQPVLVLCQYLLVAQAFAFRSRLRGLLIFLGCMATQLVPLILILMKEWEGYWFFSMPWAFLVLLIAARFKHASNYASGTPRDKPLS